MGWFDWFKGGSEWKWPTIKISRADWKHLGWIELQWHKIDDPNTITDRCIVHFYADVNSGENWPKRRTRVSDEYGKRHSFYQSVIVSWLEGGGLYGPIDKPSDWFKEWVKETHGYTRFDGKWVKPAPKIEHNENVIVPVKWGKKD